MGGKRIVIEFKLCDPRACAPHAGTCAACKACKLKLLIQEAPLEPPMLVSQRMCVGCGECVKECPRGALVVGSGP